MANTLTNLIPDVYEALDVVSRELTGFIPAVTLDAQASRAAVNQATRIPIAPAGTAENTTPGTTPPDTGDQVFTNNTLTISKSRTVPFRWLGEEIAGVNSGVGFQNLKIQQIAQAIRTLVNEVEADLAATYKRASRAFGTPGSTPFASDLGDPAQVLKILKDNGAPGDLQLVVDTTAGAALRTLAQLNNAQSAADTTLLRQGLLLPIHGFDVRESAAVVLHTVGTSNGAYAINNGNVAVGSTALTVDTGAGTVVAGDVVTFGTDANQYVVGTDLAAGALVINAPGLRVATVNDTLMTSVAAYRANMAFSRSAMVLAARAPALPEEGDSAADRMLITDPRSGLTFELAMYLQYRRVRYEISLAWGCANIKPEHTALLLG